MLDILYAVESQLPTLIDNLEWKTIYVDYHRPYVERLWAQWHDYRINFHRIEASVSDDCLFHPHPWPSAMRILEGDYEMGVGQRNPQQAGVDGPPKSACTLILKPGSAYEMTDPDGWHYVRPLDGTTLSLMVTGPPWDSGHAKPEVNKVLSGFDPTVLMNLLRQHYPTK